MNSLVPRAMWDPQPLLPALWNDSWFSQAGGVNVTEDDDHVFVEAAVPGIKEDRLDLTFHRGMLHIRTKSEDESGDGDTRSYRSLSYSVRIPVDVIDEDAEPEARCEDGMLKVAFRKAASAQPKKITVKKG